MKSIWHKINKLCEEYDKVSSDVELDDYVLDSLANEPSLEQQLSECNLSFEQAAARMKEDEQYYKDQASKCGLKAAQFKTPYAWAELISLCEEGATPERVELLIWLLSGGRLSETPDPELDENYYVKRWLCISRNNSEITDYFKKMIVANSDYNCIKVKLSSLFQIPLEKPDEAECDRVFKTLYDNGFVPSNANPEALRDNLIVVSESINTYFFLKKVKPMVYYQVYIKHTKKMTQDIGYFPNFEKLFEYTNYQLESDNGKNFKDFIQKCHLYSKLKECFPDADIPLCDYIFTKCSNLSEWYSKALAENNSCELPENIPLTVQDIVCEMYPTCFDEPPSLEYLTADPKSYPTLHKKAKAACKNIIFSELTQFADNSRNYCSKFFTEDFNASVTEENLNAAWYEITSAVEQKFNSLLISEITNILTSYVK